jgi:hypothetical protein
MAMDSVTYNQFAAIKAQIMRINSGICKPLAVSTSRPTISPQWAPEPPQAALSSAQRLGPAPTQIDPIWAPTPNDISLVIAPTYTVLSATHFGVLPPDPGCVNLALPAWFPLRT